MNERIKDLAKQAFIAERVSKDPNYKESVSTEIIVSQMQGVFEKFAELIVRECANITLDYKNHDHYMGWVDHGEEIARQFGVER